METKSKISPPHAQAAAWIRGASYLRKAAANLWPNPSACIRYGVAIVLIGGAFLTERWMEAHLVGAPVSLFVCATLLSGWFGGFGPGLLAAGLAILAFGYEPSSNHWIHLIPRDLPRAGIFALTVVVIALLSAAQRRETEALRRARE